MHWQVNFEFELIGPERFRLVTVHARTVGFRWWHPFDWARLFWGYRRGFTAIAATGCKTAYVLGEPVNSKDFASSRIVEPPRELPPGVSILAPASNWSWLTTQMMQMELPEGGKILLPGEDPAD